MREYASRMGKHLSDHPTAIARRDIRNLVRYPPFDPHAASLVIEALSQGIRLGRLHEAGGFPPYAVLNHWRSENIAFDEACVRASEAAADMLAAEVIEISDDTDRAPSCRAVSIQARQWAVKILNRKKYDPATRVEVSAGVGQADALSDDELAAIARRAGSIDGVARSVTLPASDGDGDGSGS